MAAMETSVLLAHDLASIGQLPLPELRLDWKAKWDDLPAYRSRDQLYRAMAHRLQVEAHGGLALRLRRELKSLAAVFVGNRKYNPGPTVILKPGSSLVRDWGGKRHEVAVVEGGFTYDGVTYGSLSQVASAITGTKWNGLVFFGVKRRKPAAVNAGEVAA